MLRALLVIVLLTPPVWSKSRPKPASLALLEKQLADKDVKKRTQALMQLVNHPSRAKIRLLIRATTDSSHRVRALAVLGLGISGDPRALGALHTALDDKDDSVATTALNSLARFSSPKSVPVLAKLLRSVGTRPKRISEYLTRMTLMLLGRIGTPETKPLLVRYLRKDSPFRQAAARSLARIGDKRAIPHLLAIFVQAKAEHPEIALDLAHLGATQAGQAIAERMKRVLDSKKLGRTQIRALGQYMRALATLRNARALPLIEQTLRLDNRTLRVVGIYSLADLSDPRAIRLVRPFLRSGDAMLRTAAASTLGTLGSRADAAALIRLLRDTDLTVRGTALVALGDLGSATLYPTIVPFLKSDQSILRFCAAYAAIRLGHADLGYALLDKGTRSTDNVKRAQSLSIASKLKNRRTIAMLIRALTDRENSIRALALRLLQRISGTRLGPNPSGWNRWWSANRSRYPG
ncbi:MAG: HEAT repeat domain-containing protein [Myxococcales bacterium]|nr:HEAT repeat domain-containing protein [Myxococcales bacterium]